MSAKLLYSISDENRDLQQQIGCMNGIFQLFDRHHFLSGRQIHQNQKRLPALGKSDSHGTKPNSALQRPTEKNMKKKDVKEKQRISTESSRTSLCSSSGSSRLSSIDNKHSQPESSLYSQTNFARTPSRDLTVYQPNNSLQLSQQNVDIRAVEKDSMYRDAREISIKTATKDNVGGQTLKYMDSPRPLQQPKSVKSKVLGPNESNHALSKLREDSFAAKNSPRFSYDGWESQEGLKSTIKLKELPRLSLDGRECSVRGSTTEMKSNYPLGDLQRISGNSNHILNQLQEPASYRRPSSVVAKLMGLEALPDYKSTNGNQPNQMKTFPDAECDSFTRISRTTDENKQSRISGSPRNFIKESVSSQMKNANSVKKHAACSKFPIEPAPWKQPDGSTGQTPALKGQDSPTSVPNSPLSVFGEIEKRLAQLEFKKSGKDVRALKQIFAAMQKTKEILEIRKEDQASTFVSQTGNNNSVEHNSKLANSENLKSRDQASTSIKGTSSPKSFRPPIVIKKAAKPIERASNSAISATQNEGLSGLQRIRIDDSTANRKESVDKQTKDSTPRRNRLRDLSSQPLHLTNKKTSVKSLGSVQTSKSSHPTAGKNKSGKSSESMTRLQQKELRLQKQSHSRTPSLGLSRSRGQPTESGSPQKKSKPKSLRKQPSDDQLSDVSNGTRDLSQEGDTSSLQSESYLSMASNVDSEVTSIDRSYKISSAFFLQHGKKDPPAGYTEDRSMAEPVRAGPEQPSPVSVLDATFYRDEPPSPVKKTSHAFKDDETLNSEEAEWSLMDLNHLYNSREPSFSSENDYNKLENMTHFNQDDMNIDPTQDAPTYDGTDPNHRYISEIMLASDLLRDFDSDFLTLQLHPSGNLINPNLFFVLEQTTARTRLPTDENKGKKITRSEPSTEKAQRKLIFDAVNEILVHKLVFQESYKMLLSPSMLADNSSSEKQFLRNLCSEVDRLQANNSNYNLDDGDNILRSIIRQDLMQGSMDWTDCQNEVSQLVLYVEQLIFKDLISDIVRDETDGVPGHPGRYCRQLFSK